MATISAQPTTTPTTYKNTNVIDDRTASNAQFTAAAQAVNPLYEPNTGFDINQHLFEGGYQFGWQDPLAAEIFDEYAGKNPYTTKSSDYWLEHAQPYEDPNASAASYRSPLDPREWGGTFGGNVMDEMAAEYEKRALAGTAAPATDPNAALGPEGDPNALAGGGSMHSLSPEVLNQLWKPIYDVEFPAKL